MDLRVELSGYVPLKRSVNLNAHTGCRPATAGQVAHGAQAEGEGPEKKATRSEAPSRKCRAKAAVRSASAEARGRRRRGGAAGRAG